MASSIRKPSTLWHSITSSLFVFGLFLQTPFQSKAALTPTAESSPNRADILTRLKTVSQGLTEYTVVHTQQEKFKDEMGPVIKMKIKFSKNKIYLKMLEGPMKNAEVIYKPNWNNGKAKVHKGSFPDLTLNLDPHGSRMLNHQHHPLEHLSFEHILQTLLEHAVLESSHGPEISTRITKIDSEKAIRIELKSPWKEKTEAVKKDEDIWSFSKRVHSDPFLILANNKMNYDDDLDSDKSLSVPLFYSTRTVLEIDSETFLPKRLENYGRDGKLYEKYEWQNLNPTPLLTDADFDPNNKIYDF